MNSAAEDPAPSAILVGIDDSEHSHRALRWALEEARLHGASVTVLHAVHGRHHDARSLDEDLAAAEEMIAKAVTRASGLDGDGHVELLAVADDVPARPLLRYARDHDLVVVGSRGRGGFAGLLLGSVSQQVSAHAPVPVMVIPSERRDDRRTDRDTVREIVIGVDGSPHSIAALHWAVAEARVRHCPATAVYVYPHPAATLTADVVAGLNQALADAFFARSRDAAERELGALLARELAHVEDVPVEATVVAGTPAPVLVDEAADPATMLVLGSRGRGGFAGLLLGSVSHQCLHHAAGPVVVVHRGR